MLVNKHTSTLWKLRAKLDWGVVLPRKIGSIGSGVMIPSLFTKIELCMHKCARQKARVWIAI